MKRCDFGSWGLCRGRLFALLVWVALLAPVAGHADPAGAAPILQSSFGSFSEPEALAVDQQLHAVYVLDRGAGTIDRFDSSGSPLGFSSSAAYIDENRLAGTSEGPFGFAAGESENEIAVAPSGSAAGTSGDLYATDGVGAVDVFAPSGSYLGRITAPGGGSFGYVCGVAVDPAGNVYIGDYFGSVYRFVPSANPPVNGDFDSAISGVSSPCNLAAGAATLYAASWPSGPLTAYPLSVFPAGGNTADASGSGIQIQDEGSPVTANAAYVDPLSSELYVDEGDQIAVFDAANNPIEEFGEAAFSGSRGAAVDHALAQTYVSNPNTGTVQIFAPPTPGLPTVSGLQVAKVTSSEARLEGSVKPEGEETTYRFEFVDDKSFQASGFANALSVPAAGRAVGDGYKLVKVANATTGLTPDTLYHVRLVASNSFGGAETPPRTFHTSAVPGEQICSNASLRVGLSAALPNCRAYELVTPAVKDYGYGEQAGQLGFPRVAIAATDGGSVAYQTAGPLPGATSGPFQGTSLARRAADGWHSQTISAPQAAVAGLSEPLPKFLGLSLDLNEALIVSREPPLTPDAIAGTNNLYVQRMEPGQAMSWSLLTPNGYASKESPIDSVNFGGASEDYSHFYYDTFSPQTPDAPDYAFLNHSQVYGVSNNSIYLAGILPDGTISTDALLPRETSDNGFTETRVQHMVSSDGSRVLFDEHKVEASRSPLYLRVNADQPQGPLDPTGTCIGYTLACTIEVSASQKTNGAGTAGEDPNGPQRAIFADADAGLSRVFFTSASELTNDADTGRNSSAESTDAGSDLYMYDATTGGLSDLTVDTTPADASTGANVIGVLGAADDGSTIYFVATGALGAGATSGESNLYAWHDGETRFIATLNSMDSGDWTGEFGSLTSRVASDGESVVFTSIRSLTGFDNHDATTGEPDREVYLFRLPTNSLDCISCNPSGANPIGGSEITAPGLGGLGTGFNPPRNITADGGRIFFDSFDALVSRDVNGTEDVYMYEGGKVFLISSGTGGTNASFSDATPSGDDVFFGTEEQLVGEDQDVLPDLYDARVGGGFAQPGPDARMCIADACRPPATAASTPPAPGSSSFSGPGNVRPHHHKRKHKKRHRKRRHHHAREHKAAGGKK